MTTQYIYLLQEREFVNSKQNVYKIGMTCQENHKRFNQYKKGSILLFQIICTDCRLLEKNIIKIFKEKFKQRKEDAGSESFEGDFKHMIDIIYRCVHLEQPTVDLDLLSEDLSDSSSNSVSSDSSSDSLSDSLLDSSSDSIPNKIINYEDYSKIFRFNKIIITNKKKQIGYLRFHKNQSWRQISDESTAYKSTLQEFIEANSKSQIKGPKNKWINIKYNFGAICNDIVNKCYVKKVSIYEPLYHKYAVNFLKSDGNPRKIYECIFDALNNIFITDYFDDIIYVDKTGSGHRFNPDAISIHFVDNILDLLITQELKAQYKKLARSLIIKEENEEIIFYDSDNYLLTDWITELLCWLSAKEGKITYNRYTKICANNEMTLKQINKLIKQKDLHYSKNIIIRTNWSRYNIAKCEEYLYNNIEILSYLKEKANDRSPCVTLWDLFTHEHLLMSEFLRWVCN